MILFAIIGTICYVIGTIICINIYIEENGKDGFVSLVIGAVLLYILFVGLFIINILVFSNSGTFFGRFV